MRLQPPRTKDAIIEAWKAAWGMASESGIPFDSSLGERFMHEMYRRGKHDGEMQYECYCSESKKVFRTSHPGTFL